MPDNIKNDFRKHPDEIVFINQVLIAVPINVLDYPSRLDKYDMDIIIDEDEIKPDKCYVMMTNPITFVFNNDKKQKINDFFERKMITEEKKNKLLFNYCNIISSDTFWYIVNEILNNKNNDDYVYNNIKYRLIKESNVSKLCNSLNISKDEIEIINDYNYK